MYNNIVVFNAAIFAGMAELADALDSGSSEGNFVKVQVLLPAPKTAGIKRYLPFLFLHSELKTNAPKAQFSLYRD